MVKRFRLLNEEEEEEEDMTSAISLDSYNIANVLMLLSRGGGATAAGESISAATFAGGDSPEGKTFECKTCSRKFTTFQALGGHRASHKKPRLGGATTSAAAPEKPRVHECSICGLEFAIGQALGGHMRRHRAAPEGNGSGHSGGLGMEKKRSGQIDLNLPPLERGEEEEEEVRRLPKLLGFTLTPAMVDCFH